MQRGGLLCGARSDGGRLLRKAATQGYADAQGCEPAMQAGSRQARSEGLCHSCRGLRSIDAQLIAGSRVQGLPLSRPASLSTSFWDARGWMEEGRLPASA